MGTYADMLKEAENNEQTKDLTPTFFEFKDKGDELLGRLISIIQVESSQNKGTFYNQYLFDTDDGLFKCALGGATDKEVKNSFAVGHVYSIEFMGKAKLKGGRSVNKFKILEIGGTQNQPAPAASDDVPF